MKTPQPLRTRARTAPGLYAVIELGSTSVRMIIAEVLRSGNTRVLDSLQQAISLGRDTFTSSTIGQATTEACVAALKSFSKVIAEYNITDPGRIRAVASSAVREASNRSLFLDRMQIATGIQVQTLEEAEVNRLTYRAVRPILGKQPAFRQQDTLAIEVGGGSTEALMFHRGKVTRSHMYRLGSLRLAQSLDNLAVSRQRTWQIMRQTIDQTVEQIRTSIQPVRSLTILGLGADLRFALSILQPEWDRQSLTSVPIAALTTFTEEILSLSTEELVMRHHISLEDAETVRPALLIYCRLAASLKVRRIYVAEVNIRTGLLLEMASGGVWTREFKNQITNSAVEVASRYQVDMRHARHVCAYALNILRFLHQDDDVPAREEMILTVAALLHEVGGFINARAHHKHSYYIIANTDLFGLSTRDIMLAALVARYHRRSPPKASHAAFTQLARQDRLIVIQLAAILRVANTLDANKNRTPLHLTCRRQGRVLLLLADVMQPLSLIQQQVSERADLFTQVYGMDVVVRQTSKERE